MWFLILYAAFAVWVLFDSLSRKNGAGAVGWGLGTLILGPVVLPFYLARRPLKQGEVREGGPAWNILKNFAILWTILMAVAGINAMAEMAKHTSGMDSDAARVGAGLGIIMGMGLLLVLWFLPTAGAALLGFLLKKNTIVETGPTGPLVGTDGTANALNGFAGLFAAALVAVVVIFTTQSGTAASGSSAPAGRSVSGLGSTAQAVRREWVVNETTKEIDGTRQAVLRLDSEDEIDGIISKHRPYLAIQCKGGKPEVVVNVGKPVQHEYGEFDTYAVRLRIDSGAPTRQRWTGSTNHVALFSPAPTRLIQQLGKAETLLFEFTPFQESERTVRFNVSGLASKLKPVAAVCGTRL